MARNGGRKVGELAAATGLTVRTLHYYEQIGLLLASERSTGGHRLYSSDDVARLYRICLLRRLGFPLAEITTTLDDPAWNLRAALGRHLAELDARLNAGQELRRRVAGLLDGADGGPDGTEGELLEVMEGMAMLETTVRQRISVVVYADLEAAYTFLVDVFGLGPGSLTRGPGGAAVHGEVQAGDGMIWLHPESVEYGLASPRSLGAATASVVVMVDDVDAHHRYAAARGAVVVYEPVDQPYGYREYSARDLEGGLWSFMKELS
jgi:MerR family transcriptional regulator, thiopeptide resistance regulator